MPNITAIRLATILAATFVGQTLHLSAQTTAALKSADDTWNDVVAKTRPSPRSRIALGKDKTSEEITTRIRQQADQAAQTAQDARQFYTRYPSHPKAVDARKIEAVYTLRSAQDGNPGKEQNAITIASAFCDNTSYPVADRFETALVLERFKQTQKLKAKSVKDEPAEWLKLADRLKAQYGDLPALQDYYIEIARRADVALASEIAKRTLASSMASAKAKGEAQSIVDRAAMLGKPLALKLPQLRGGTVDIGGKRNKITVIVVWSPSNLDSLDALRSFSGGFPPGVEVVYLGVGQVTDVLNGASRLPVSGTQCYMPNGAAGKSVANALRLRYAPAPCVYVLNQTGNVTGYGHLNELSTLLAKTIG